VDSEELGSIAGKRKRISLKRKRQKRSAFCASTCLKKDKNFIETHWASENFGDRENNRDGLLRFSGEKFGHRKIYLFPGNSVEFLQTRFYTPCVVSKTTPGKALLRSSEKGTTRKEILLETIQNFETKVKDFCELQRFF
jgi:hypothetical protein